MARALNLKEICEIIESGLKMEKVIDEIAEKLKKDIDEYVSLAKKFGKGYSEIEDAFEQLQNRLADLETAGGLMTNPEGYTEVVSQCLDYSFLGD